MKLSSPRGSLQQTPIWNTACRPAALPISLPDRYAWRVLGKMLLVLWECGSSGIPSDSVQIDRERFQPAPLQNAKGSHAAGTLHGLGRKDRWRKERRRTHRTLFSPVRAMER